MSSLRYPVIVALLLVCGLAGAEDSQDSQDSQEVAPPLDDSLADLNEEKCAKKRNGCCSEMYLGDDETLATCFSIHSDRLPADGDSDMGKTLKFLSCFVECMYKQRKYVGKSDTINMKMVRLDAETLYAGRPKEQAYHIKAFDYCRKDALNVYKMLKASPGAKAMLRSACRPFLLMVYLCMSEYHEKYECPYFRWEGNAKANTKQQCSDARARCYQIDGIPLPEEQ